MFLFSLYAVAIAIGLCLYWFLHSSPWKKSLPIVQATPVSENKEDPPEDGSSSSSSATNYFKGHKSPRKVQLKEVHHSNETASVKVITPDGVTLVQTSSIATTDHQNIKSKDNKSNSKDQEHHHHHQRNNNNNSKIPHKRRPAPPPPPKQPPKRPPPPPPPESPEPAPAVVVVLDKDEPPGDIEKELQELRIDERNRLELNNLRFSGHISSSSSSPQLLGNYSSSNETECCSSPDLPLPPPPPPASDARGEMAADEPLPPPPDALDVEMPNRTLDSTSLVYPKNSYMSYRSEKKLGRQGFDGNYRRSFHASSSSVDLMHLGNSFIDGKDMLSPSSWEQMHNIRQHGTTVIFHSDTLHSGNSSINQVTGSCQDFPMIEKSEKSYITSDNNQTESESAQDVKNSECAMPCAASHENLSSPNFIPVNQNLSQCQYKQNEDVVINCSEHCEVTTKENNAFANDNCADSAESDSNSLNSVDQNQNTIIDSRSYERTSLVNNNNNELINRTNSSTQTTDTPRLKRKHSKTKQELECERLSMDFVHRYGDIALKNLLVPAANHRTMSDYMEGLLSLELEKSGQPVRAVGTTESAYKKQNGHWNENNKNDINETEEMKLKQQDHCMDILDSQNLNGDNELRKMREDLMVSIKKKVENLRNEQLLVREEIQRNENLGKEITNRVQKLAKPNEVEKYMLHVEEMEKIMNLLLSLSGRLAKAVNVLESLPNDTSPEEKRVLVAKRDKLMEQHEDARRLKESIDRRSNQVSTFLHRYFSEEEYDDYDYFIKMKTKLIVDLKEMDEKINLGEEQLTALRNSIDAHMWKSANS